LREDAIERVANCIEDYRLMCDSFAKQQGFDEIDIVAVATSAARDAQNSSALVQRLHANGVELKIIPGTLEANLSFLGASCQFHNEDLCVVDVGGGSTEVIFGTAEAGATFAHSFDIGCRRITEMFLASDPPTDYELSQAKHFIKKKIEPVLLDQLKASRLDRVIGVAGTATSVVSIDQKMEVYNSEAVNKTVVSKDTLSEVFAFLCKQTHKEREGVVGLEPKRAGVIVAGMLILQTVLEVLGKDSFTVSESDLLQGLVMARCSNNI
jgi:exopolyphosphatase/guanosine-5'-triphosphate,3'-diphosphate pyrophosphatase